MDYPCNMRRLLICLGLLIAGHLALPAEAFAQEGITKKQQEKIQAKKGKEDKKAKVRKEKEDRNRHLSIQDKETRKRIKRNTKRADRSGMHAHRDPWPGRWFTRRR